MTTHKGYESLVVWDPSDARRAAYVKSGWEEHDVEHDVEYGGLRGVKYTYRRPVEPNLRSTMPTTNAPPPNPYGIGIQIDPIVALPFVHPTSKDTNPKQAFADGKIPLDIFPDTAAMLGALALLDGAMKYGKHNWRGCGVRAATYVGACRRHLMAWYNGEEDAADGVPHLAHALACLAILVDAQAAGKLTDDRPPRIDVAAWQKKLTDWVPTIKKRHEGKNPRHWTIQDTPSSEGPVPETGWGC